MSLFPAVRIEGGLLGPDTVEQLLAGDLPGQKPKDFGLDGRRSLTDEIASVFADARAQWEVFQRRLERLPDSDPPTSVTRDAWVIPFLSLLGYELRYNPRAYEVDGLTFAISHRAGEAEDAPPVHIVGARQELGRVAPAGRPRLAPHSLVQEFLNRTEHLWGIVTNGLILRLLRDTTYVRRQAYVEFDLRQIFEEQRFADFAVLYRLLHRSRLPRSSREAQDCLLERYHQHAVEQGGRVRERLRCGVEECIKRLADGFLAHPKNAELRRRVASSEEDIPLAARHSPLARDELYRQLLRLVYRLLFLLVSEDRGLISAAPLYRDHYGVARLRRLLDRRSAYTEHDDLWCSLRVLWKVLSDERLAGLLGAAPLNGELFAPLALDHCTITNRDFLEAFWHLAYYRESPSAPPRRVNYAALDVEELGSVYESLLEYHPQIDASGAVPRFELAFGSERKSTGSYYTPPELVAELIRSALDPVIADRFAVIERAASSEWRAVKESLLQAFGEAYVHSIVSRLGSLAESHGDGRRSLSPHERLSEGGALWTDQPNAPSGDIGPSEHSRGLGTARDEGISAIPEHRLGQPSGAGNLPPVGRANSVGSSASGSASSGTRTNSGQTTHRPPAQPLSEEQITRLWHSLPLAARHSLLAEHAVLSIRILDPACGSGHFLLAAARRLGKELAKIRTGEDEPAPEQVREAIRDVVAHCIYGVDKNPLAVELCRVALWLEAHCAGKPLTFLDHRIRCGDSLVGVLDLGVLERGIPDEALHPVSTDTKAVAALLKKRNRNERRALESGQMRFPFAPERIVDALGAKHHDIEAIADDAPAAVREKKSRYDRLLADPERLRIAEACDLWTATFFQRYTPELTTSPAAITTDAVTDRLADRAHPQALAAAQAIASEHRFFHWPLEFPEVFTEGGFDVVLSNPPYGGIKETRFHRYSPMRGTGNLFAHFLSRAIDLLAPGGAMGFVVPLSLACGETFEPARRKLYQNFGLLLASHYSIRPAKLFPGVEQRITLVRALYRGQQPCQIYSTRLHRWHYGEEHKVIANAEFGFVGTLREGLIPKVAGKIGASIYGKIRSQPHKLREWLANEHENGEEVYYHRVARYWIKAYNFIPFFQRQGEEPGVSTNLKALTLGDRKAALRFLCLLNSSLFYYWWLAHSDEFDVLESEIVSFGVPGETAPWPSDDQLEVLVNNLMESYKANAVRRSRRVRGGGTVLRDEFRPRHSLREIYAIDDAIAPLYSLTREELEFLKTYDLEFRTDEE